MLTRLVNRSEAALDRILPPHRYRAVLPSDLPPTLRYHAGLPPDLFPPVPCGSKHVIILVRLRRCSYGGETESPSGTAPYHLAFTRYCYYQYCMLNDEAGGQGKTHILRNVDCKIQRGGGAMKEMLNAKNIIN